MSMQAIDPATGEVVGTYDELPSNKIHEVIVSVDQAAKAWRRVAFAERAKPMRKVAALLRERSSQLASLMAHEMGKPVRDGAAEAEKCAQACEFYAGNAEKFLAREAVPGGSHFVTFNPLGVVLAVMPWNFPLWQVFRFAAPGLMAGNGCVLKHASNVPGCALAIEGLFDEAEFPKNLFRTLLIRNDKVGQVIEHPLVRAVTLTGSSAAGRAVAAKAGAMLKKSVLELGGSDPYLVLADADLDVAVDVCVKGRLVNSGQSCIAAKRFIVVEGVRGEFEKRFVERMAAVKMGDPSDASSEIGPMARHDLREGLHRQVEASLAKGARCLLGGVIPEGRGAYYPPTVLTDVGPGMSAYEEELFGPVAAIIPVPGEDQAIWTANDSSFGLGACVITRDLSRGERVAAELIDSGSVFVNEPVRSDPKLPFGGVKESGYGRELSSYGIKEFVNIKTVLVNEGH